MQLSGYSPRNALARKQSPYGHSSYELHIPPELQSKGASYRGFREVEALIERQIQTQKQACNLIEQSYGRQIKRVAMLLDQSSRKSAVLVDQETTLLKEREQLTNRIKDAKELNSILHRVPEISQRLTKLEQVQTMQKQVQEHLNLEQSRFTIAIQDEQNERNKSYQGFKKQLSQLADRKSTLKKQLAKVQHQLRFQRSTPLILKFEERANQQELFKRDLQSLESKTINFQFGRIRATKTILGTKETFQANLRQELQRVRELKSLILSQQLDQVEWEGKIKDQESAMDHFTKQIEQKDQQVICRQAKLLEIVSLAKNYDQYFQVQVRNYRLDSHLDVQLRDEISVLQGRIREMKGENFRLRAGYERVGEVVASKISLNILKDLMDVQKTI